MTEKTSEDYEIILPTPNPDSKNNGVQLPSPSFLGKDEFIWHYCSGESLLNILRGDTFWASSFNMMNDIKEFTYGISIFEHELNLFLKADNIEEATKNIVTKIFDKIQSYSEYLFVLSFSQAKDSITQWAMYGGDSPHCIGLKGDLALLTKNKSKDRNEVDKRSIFDGTWINVVYDPNNQKRLVQEFLGFIVWMNETTSYALWNDETFDVCVGYLTRILLGMKRPEFATEREVRTFFYSSPEDIEYRISNYGITPYVEVTGCPIDKEDKNKVYVNVKERHPLPIVDIGIGPYAFMESDKNVLEHAKIHYGYPHAGIWESSTSFRI